MVDRLVDVVHKQIRQQVERILGILKIGVAYSQLDGRSAISAVNCFSVPFRHNSRSLSVWSSRDEDVVLPNKGFAVPCMQRFVPGLCNGCKRAIEAKVGDIS